MSVKRVAVRMIGVLVAGVFTAGVLTSSTGSPVAAVALAEATLAVGAPATATSSAESSAGGSRWLPPIETPLRVSGPFRAPVTAYASGHRGIDLPATPGTRVLAPAAGVVSFVGKVVDRPVLSLRINDRTVVSFEPLEVAEGGLSVGDSVLRGQELGVMAEGGHCEAECVHLGVRVDGEYVNPMRFFAGKPVLLPWQP